MAVQTETRQYPGGAPGSCATCRFWAGNPPSPSFNPADPAVCLRVFPPFLEDYLRQAGILKETKPTDTCSFYESGQRR